MERSRLDEIEDLHFTVSHIVHKGKSENEVENLLRNRGVNEKQIKYLFESVYQSYQGIRLLSCSKTVRGLNLLIDLLLILFLTIFCAKTLPSGFNQSYGFLIVLIIPFTYYLLFETVFGMTLGKLITGSIVVDNDGKRPSFYKILIRTVCRFWIGQIKSSFLNDDIFHDKISSTFVVNKNRWRSIYETF
jgi:hypothetical protein